MEAGSGNGPRAFRARLDGTIVGEQRLDERASRHRSFTATRHHLLQGVLQPPKVAYFGPDLPEVRRGDNLRRAAGSSPTVGKAQERLHLVQR